MNVVELRNVFKNYQLGKVTVRVLKNINLIVKKGEFLSIIGPSGSGKSTLLNLIGCLDKPTSGKIYIDGIDSSGMNDNQLALLRNKKIGFVFQMFNLIGRLSALENVMLPMWYAGVPYKERIRRAKKLLKIVGLEGRENHKPNELSGGERQRVAIARALANEPELILADEPTGNLDTKTGEKILEILEHLNKNGKTVILITHNPSLSKKAKREVKLIDGEIH